MISIIRLAVLLGLAVAGCTLPDTPGPCAPFRTTANADEPCGEELYFPAGVAIDPDGDVLYTTSYNADLRYSGAVVQSLDLFHHDCVTEYARIGVLPPGCAEPLYPIFNAVGAPILDGGGQQLRLHLTDPDPRSPAAIAAGCPIPLLPRRGANVVDTEASCCQFDVLDPAIIECDARPFVTSAVKVGNFAGTIRVQRRGGPIRSVLPLPVSQADGCPAGSSPASDGIDPATGRITVCVGTPPSNRRLWIPVRGDASVTWIDVDKPYLGTKVHAALPSLARLSCFDPTNPQPGRLLDSCNRQRITVRDFHDPTHPSNVCSLDTDCPQTSTCGGLVSGVCDVVPIPPEPFGIWIDEGHQIQCDPNGKRCDAKPSPYAHVLVTHLLGGQITLINADAISPVSTAELPLAKESVVLDVRGNFFNSDVNGNSGGFAVAPLTPGDPRSYWFTTSNLNPTVALFRISAMNLVFQGVGFTVAGGPYATGDDVRDVQVQPDGSRAFFIDNHPPSLFTVDTRPLLVGGLPTGEPTNQVVDVIDVCQGPSHLQMRQFTIAGAPGEPPHTATRLYAVCFQSNQVWAVDPDLPVVRSMITTGRGPNDIAFNFPASRRAIAAHCTNGKRDLGDGSDVLSGETDTDCGGECARCDDGKRCLVSDDCASGVCSDGNGMCEGEAGRSCTCGKPRLRRGYVSNFTDSTIAVIDLEPGSSTENRVISRIGITSPPFNQ